jgi:para-aminobenzoate synthetase component 2
VLLLAGKEAKLIYFVDHFDSFSFNVKAWLESGSVDLEVVRVAADDRTALARVQKSLCPVVLSPGPKSPLDYPLSVSLCRDLAGRVPLLGVCLGHQLLGAAFGWSVAKSAEPFHGSRKLIRAASDGSRLFDAGASFQAASYNSLVLAGVSSSRPIAASFLRVTAVCEHGDVQAIESISGVLAAGVQFHPESFLSEQQLSEQLRDRWIRYIVDWQREPLRVQPRRPC